MKGIITWNVLNRSCFNQTQSINVYRSFNPNEMTAREKLKQQLMILNNVDSSESIVSGDFNWFQQNNRD